MPSIISVSIVVLLLIVLVESEIKLNPNWVKPDIYSRDRSAKAIKSNVEANSENAIPNKIEAEDQIYQEDRKLNYNKEDLSVYYKKIVKFLIRKSKVKPFTRDPSDEDEFLIRTIHFKITKKQIEQLERSNDIHELDGLFSDIIYQSEGGSLNIIQEALLSWSDLIIIKSSEYINWTFVKFACFISVIVLTAVLVKKRFNVHIIIALILVAVLFNFFGQYHLCNKRKEYEKLATLSTTVRNPCDLKVPKGFVDYFGSFFSGNAKDQCIKHLMDTYEPHIEFCDPLEVFLDFSNNIIYKQISQFFIRFGDLSTILMGSVRWPFNLIILPLMFWLLVFGIKLCFKYGFLTAKELIFSKRAPTPTIAGPSSEHLSELTGIAKASLRLLETRSKRKIRKRIFNKNKQIENRVEPLPQIMDVTDVSDSESVNSPPPSNKDNEFQIVPVDTKAILEPSSTETTSDVVIKKKDD